MLTTELAAPGLTAPALLRAPSQGEPAVVQLPDLHRGIQEFLGA